MRGPSGLTSKQEARLRERFEEDRRRFRREDLPRILAEAQGSLERLEGDPIQGDLGRRFRVLRDLLAAWDRGAAERIGGLHAFGIESRANSFIAGIIHGGPPGRWPPRARA